MPNTVENAKTILTSLKESLFAVDVGQTEALADAVLTVRREKKKIYVAGAGRSLLIIRTFAMRMMHLGLDSHVVGETTAPAIQQGDLLIFGSGSGETETLSIVLARAKSVNAKVAVITRNPKSKLGSRADLVVRIPVKKEAMEFQPGGTAFEQAMLILCDALVLRILEKGRLLKDRRDLSAYIMRFHANLE
jgi:6-phospho-3-hexuloisomerase